MTSSPPHLPSVPEEMLARAAGIMRGKPAEAWLLDNWCRALWGLGAARGWADGVPAKPELRRRLKAVQKRADALRQELHGSNGLPDVDVVNALERVAGNLDLTILYRNLDHLLTRTREELGRSARKAGRPSAPSKADGLRPVAQCALLVIAARATRESGKKSRTQAQAVEAAELLWEASGGDRCWDARTLDKDHDPVVRWRRPFEEAKEHISWNPWVRERWERHFLYQPPKVKSSVPPPRN